MVSGLSTRAVLRRKSLRLCIASAFVLISLYGFALATTPNRPDCLGGEWIDDAIAFVVKETGLSVPIVCVRWAPANRLRGLVSTGGQNDVLAAVFVPATGEILLVDDLDLDGPLGRSYVVHELVHAQQFELRLNEHVRCPGALESGAYSIQALYLHRYDLKDDAFLLQVLGMFQSACGYSDF